MKFKKITRNPNFYFLFFFIFLFFYYLLVFNPSLYYHHHQPMFLLGKTYLKEFLLYPGGLVEWVTQFFLQFFYFNMLGALITSVLSLSVFVIVYRLIEKIEKLNYSLILSFLPVVFLLIIQNNYKYPLLITFKYSFVLIFFLFYVKISNRYKIFIIPLSCLIYYILGGWAYLFYVVLCLLHELLFSKDRVKYIYAGLNVVVYLIYPYIAARYLFIITLKEAYLYIAPYKFYFAPFLFDPNSYFYLFFLSLPMLQVGLFLYLKYIKAKIKSQNKSSSRLHHILTQSLFVIFVGILILTFSFDQQEKKKIKIDYLAEQGQWREVLSLSQEIDGYDRMVNFNVNRAFYHTGQLLDNLFYYPQLLGADGLFIDKIIASQIAIPASDLYFDLGHINASQAMAHEAQTKFKHNPRILKRLALINIINEKYIPAKKFLEILKKSILHKNWAKHYENYLSNESLIKSDSLIQLKRKQKPDFDFFISNENPNFDLTKLLKGKEDNKMAFEYLMAYYLLECRLGDILKHLNKFKNLGYRKFPRHIEEALILAKTILPSKIMIERSVSPQRIEQFKQFNIILAQHKNEAKAKVALEKEFPNTYWYYVRYVCPKKTKLELKRRKIDGDIL
jgi:hypothetical protein